MRRRSILVAGVAASVTAGLIAPQAAQSRNSGDPRAERAAVRAEAARQASQIDTSKASLSEIDTAIAALEQNVTTQQAALQKATDDLERAETDLAAAQTAITELEGEISTLRNEMGQRAIQAYVNPSGEDLLTILENSDFTSAAEQSFYVELRSQSDTDLQDRLEGAQVDLADQQDKAETARQTAAEKKTEQAEKLKSVESAKADQETLYANVEATLDSQIARSIELAATDRELSAQIAEEQAALAARLAAARAAQQEQAAATPSTPAPTPPAAGGGGGGGTQAPSTRPPSTPTPTNAPSTPTTRPPVTAPPTTSGGGGGSLPPVSGGGSGTGTGGIKLCTVGGITVNCAMSGQLTNLLNGARAAGINLGGSGWRDPANQIALRKANCGTSYYAIYEMPASSCRPPTAKPGSSQHEIGLAVDFSYNGRTICYPYATCAPGTNAAYDWLTRNAASYGFYKLASEAWHWSPSGK